MLGMLLFGSGDDGLGMTRPLGHPPEAATGVLRGV
jgi:hypothetical protein